MTIELNPITSGYSTGLINANFQTVEEVLNNQMLKRDGLEVGEANEMHVPLDMNSYDILNVGTLRAQDFILSPDNQSFLDQLYEVLAESQEWAELSQAWASAPEDETVLNNLYSSYHYSRKSSQSAGESENSALLSESFMTASQAAAQQAQAYSELGLATGDVFDLGYVSDDIIYFPTDFGSIA